MSEPLPNCPLCDEDMNLEGGPNPDKAWCNNPDCALDLVSLPLAALVTLAALRKPLTKWQAADMVTEHHMAVAALMANQGHLEDLRVSSAAEALRAALVGKR